MLIDVICRRGVCVCVSIHETAPRTPHGPDIQKDRAVQISCALKGKRSPGIPIDGLENCPFEVCRFLPAEVVGTPLGTTRSHCRDQTKQQNNDLLAHAKSDSAGSDKLRYASLLRNNCGTRSPQSIVIPLWDMLMGSPSLDASAETIWAVLSCGALLASSIICTLRHWSRLLPLLR